MEKRPLHILYVCHDGELFGSQNSLLLMLQYLPLDVVQPVLSIAKAGALNEAMKSLPHIPFISHKRIYWAKHDRRSVIQRCGDVLALIFSAPGRVQSLTKLIKAHQIDIVHSNSIVSLEGALAAWVTGTPHIWHIRELFMTDNPKLNMTLGRALSRWLIDKLSSRVLCISKVVQAQFSTSKKQTSKSKYQLLYNALPDCNTENIIAVETKPSYSPQNMRRINEENNTFTLGYIGRLSEGKRFQDLVMAMGILKENGFLEEKNIQLRVAGRFVDKPFEEKINTLIQQYQLTDNIHFLGYQSDLKAFHSSIKALVVPSLNEPFGRVVIEAMSHETPCIATNSGGIPEIITHKKTGLLFTAKSPESLASTLEYAIKTPEMLTNLQKNARREVAKRFNIEAQIVALTRCYKTVQKAQPQ